MRLFVTTMLLIGRLLQPGAAQDFMSFPARFSTPAAEGIYDVNALSPHLVGAFHPFLDRRAAEVIQDRVSISSEQGWLHMSNIELGRPALRLGLGTIWFGRRWPMGNRNWGMPPDQEIEDQMLKAFTRMKNPDGLLSVDTARSYGETERRIGEFFSKHQDLREKAFIATKWGEIYNADEDKGRLVYSVENLRESFQASTRLLGSIDLFYIHMPGAAKIEDLRNEAIRHEMQAMKQRGDVRYLGASISSDPLLAQALEEGLLDGFDVIQIPADVVTKCGDLIAELHRRGKAIILNSPIRTLKFPEGTLDSVKQAAYRQRFLDLLSHPEISMILVGSQHHLETTIDYMTNDSDRSLGWLSKAIQESDPQIVHVNVDAIKGPQRNTPHHLGNPGWVAKGLPDIVKAAIQIPLRLYKKGLIGAGNPQAIDNEAEAIVGYHLRRSKQAWFIAGAEGAGDGMSTLLPTQEFGAEKEGGPRIRLSYDPLDGTEAAARGEPGANSLFAIGSDLPIVHDERSDESVGVLVPALATVIKISLKGSREAALMDAIRLLSPELGKKLNELSVAIWEPEENGPLMTALKKDGIRVTGMAAAETNPIIANDVEGTGNPYDIVITGKGLVEAQIAAVLTEQRGGEGWIRKKSGMALPIERWTGGRERENYVVMSAATQNPWTHCAAPQIDPKTGVGTVQLIISDPTGRVVRLTIRRKLNNDDSKRHAPQSLQTDHGRGTAA